MQLSLIILSAVFIFIFSLQTFAKELRKQSEGRLGEIIGSLTRNRWRGFALGFGITAIIQSSSAVSAIAVSLVEAGVLTFRNSLGVLLGTNVGTTTTAWLVAFKLGNISHFIIVAGGILGLMPGHIRAWGKRIFYLGFILFALQFISESVEPLRENPHLQGILTHYRHYLFGLLAGIIFTVIAQSSSVTSGLAVVLHQQGILADEFALALVFGANIGTTSTALIAAFPLSVNARKTAVANLIFNIAGVLLLLPFIPMLAGIIIRFNPDGQMLVAWGHLILNLFTAFIFLFNLKPFEQWLNHRMAPKESHSA